MIRSLAIITALCLCGTSASALTIQECRAKYKAMKATGTFGDSWIGFQEKNAVSTPRPPRRNQPLPRP
jgi:hypothetical protein